MGRMKRPSVRQQKNPSQKFIGHTDLVRGVIHLPAGKRIVTCSGDGSLRLWNLEDGSQIGKDWQDGKSPVNTIALSPHGKTVACGSDDGVVRLWNIDTGMVTAKWTGHSDRVLSVCWNRGGQRVVSGSADGTARVWDVKSKTILGPINTGHDTLYAVIYSPDELMIATGGSSMNEQFIKIWDAKTFKLVTTLKGHEWTVRCLAWAADGNTLMSGSADCSIRTWTTTTWEQLTTSTENYTIVAITISPNGRILASALLGGTAELWDIEGDQRICSLQHASPVHCISFSADGRLLATGCNDNNTYTWDVSTIVEEAGFNGLLSDSDSILSTDNTTSAIQAPQDPSRKSTPDVNDTRWPLKPLNDTHRLPQGFFDTEHPSSTRPLLPSPAHRSSVSRPRALLDDFSSLFRHPHSSDRDATSHDTPTPSRSFTSTLVHFYRKHRSDSERRPPEVEVPCTAGRARNIHAAQRPKTISPALDNTLTITIGGISPPPINDAMRQSSGSLHARQSSANAVTEKMSARTSLPPDIVKRQTGSWYRFRFFLCCNSSEDTSAPNPR